MKKLYFFLALFLSLVGVTQVHAQDDEVTITVDMANGHWTQWNGTPGTSAYARAWFSDSNPVISILCMQGGNKATDVRGVEHTTCANNMSAWGDAANELRFFNNYGTYQIMVDKGWYLKSVEFDFNCETSQGMGVTIAEEDEVISADATDDQHVSWTNTDEDVYAVNFVVTKQGGNNGFARTSNFKVVVAPLSEETQAINDLKEIYEQYSAITFTAGDEPGQYDADAVAAFNDALAKADYDDPDTAMEIDAMDVEEIVALGQAIKDAYEAVLATRVPMHLENGYYRIRSNMNFTETFTDEDSGDEIVNENVQKYMSLYKVGKNFRTIWGTIEDMDADATSLWKVTMTEDGLFDIANAGFESHFVDINASNTIVPLSAESDSLMALDPLGPNENDEIVVAIRQASKPENDAYYYHCYAHSSGNLKAKDYSNYIVLYYSSADASKWIFESVDDEEAQSILDAYAPIKADILMQDEYQEIIVDAKEKLALAKHSEFKELITETSQFSSPWTESSEGSLANLLDDNKSTYWHSAWSGGSVANHTHYLQVALTEGVDDELYMRIARRPVANDHITLWGVFGSNDAEAEAEAWTELASLKTPFGNNTETITSDPFEAGGFKYLRFYIDNTTGTNGSNSRGYGHVSEFQLLQEIPNPTSQFVTMGEVAKNLDDVVKELRGKDTVTKDEFDRLKAAYEAFIAAFVDPAELGRVLEETEGTEKIVVVGTNPGQWSDGTVASNFKALYDEAKAYYDGSAFEADKITNYVTSLTEMRNNILNSANKIQTDKWYMIRFDSEANFEANNWDLVAGRALTTESKDGLITTSQALWDKVVAVAKQDQQRKYFQKIVKDSQGQDSIVNDSVWVYTIMSAQPEEVGTGNGVYFIDESNLANKDMALFRFVAVGDSAYVLQNKATGLFLRGVSDGSTVNASLHPTLFKASPIGYGKNLLAVSTLSTGYDLHYLHGQKAGNALVTWNAYTANSASALYIEEVETVSGSYAPEANILLEPGSINGICYPVELKATTVGDAGQAWTVTGVDGNEIKLAKITDKIYAGRPFIFVFGPANYYQEGQPAEPVKFAVFTDDFAPEPQTDLALKGTYARTGLHKGDVYCIQNKFDVATVDFDGIMVTNPIYVAGNSAYISNDPAIDHTAELSIVFDENAEDGIQAALETVSKAGAVYTIDGRLVSRRATINELSRFGKGLYIINGYKVVVK